MTIRNRLTLQFFGLVLTILFVSSLVVYVFSEQHRKEDFYIRLRGKAEGTAKLLITVDEVSVDLLRKIEKDNPMSLPGEGILIWSPQNKVIFDFDPGDAIQVDKAMLDRIRREGEVRFEKGNFEVLGYRFRDRSGKFIVVIAAEDIFGKRRVHDLRWVLFSVFVTSLIFVGIAGWMFADRALYPISNMIRQVKRITISRLNLRLARSSQPDEISRLADTFNDMLERLEKGVKTQKDFIANASHELRTPLTAMTGQLEVALLSQRSPERYRQVLESVLEDIKSLNRTSNRLLLLAQANAEEVNIEMEGVRVDDLVWQCKEEIRKLNPDYTIRVDLQLQEMEEEGLLVLGNATLLKTCLLNLFENACKYSADHKAEITIRTSESGPMVVVADHGIGIPEQDLPHIFQPFFRASNSARSRGHGIGLSLVQRICEIHGGHIGVKSELGKGTVFTLSLPALRPKL